MVARHGGRRGENAAQQQLAQRNGEFLVGSKDRSQSCSVESCSFCRCEAGTGKRLNDEEKEHPLCRFSDSDLVTVTWGLQRQRTRAHVGMEMLRLLQAVRHSASLHDLLVQCTF